LIDDHGRINSTWLRFFVDLYERTGGGATDKVDASQGAAETAQAAADAADAAATTAQTAADDAQTTADDLESRFDFNLDLDLR